MTPDQPEKDSVKIEDDIAEALRGRKEMENEPSKIITWEQVREAVGR
jgi:hypothetical protein